MDFVKKIIPPSNLLCKNIYMYIVLLYYELASYIFMSEVERHFPTFEHSQNDTIHEFDTSLLSLLLQHLNSNCQQGILKEGRNTRPKPSNGKVQGNCQYFSVYNIQRIGLENLVVSCWGR